MPTPPETVEPLNNSRISRVLFWHVTREFSVPLMCCVLGFIALFVISDLLDYLSDFVEAKSPFVETAWFFVVRQPVNLVHVLPMSVLLAASFVVNVMGRHHEITAVRSAGISLFRWSAPIWLMSLLMSFLTLGLNEYVVPACTQDSETLYAELTTTRKAEGSKQHRLAFRDKEHHRDWFFESFQASGAGTGVLIKQFRSDRTVEWELRADSARYEDGSWEFVKACITQYSAEDMLPTGPEERHTLYCDPRVNEPPQRILNSLRPAEELSARELFRLMRADPLMPPTTRNVFTTLFWYRICFPFSCLMAGFVGVAMSITRERGSALRGFAGAIGIIFLYHATSQFLLLLAKTGRLPPIIGGSLGTLGFIGWGVYDLYRKR